MRAIVIFSLLAAASTLSRAAASDATVVAESDESCGVAIVAVDGRPFKSPQQTVHVSPGHHVLLLRVSPAAYPNFSSNVPQDGTFDAGGQYTVRGLFSPDSGVLKVRFGHKKGSHSK
jgi:hypothetical protein